jgi:ketosteroid isomerase-like protein
MTDLNEIEAIKRLKYAYLRALDLKQWDELAACLTEDATAAYSDGKYSFSGREQIMDFLKQALGSTSKITVHRAQQPEIALSGPTSATGTWALDDVVIDTDANITLRGAAFYRDEYVKTATGWKIRHTGYQRVYEEVESRGDTPTLRLTANRWQEKR